MEFCERAEFSDGTVLTGAEAWQSWVDANTDSYGLCIMQYAQQWAEEMEARIANGETVEQCAKETGRIVDDRPGFGITGFMYGAAVQMLAKAWKHGEALRRWSNVDIAGEEQGARANESGGTINPAILTIGSTD